MARSLSVEAPPKMHKQSEDGIGVDLDVGISWVVVLGWC